MKTIKQRADEVIECFCVPRENRCSACQREDREGDLCIVMIGDVLEKIKNSKSKIRYRGDGTSNSWLLTQLWKPCGFTKSLNEIFKGEVESNEASSITESCHLCKITKRGCGNSAECCLVLVEAFKDPNIQALLGFLVTIKTK